MPTRLRLWHTWQDQIRALLPQVRATRAANLALWSLGLLWAGSASLPAVAAALPLPADDASLERRLRRWLVNAAVRAGALLPALLANNAGQEVLLVFDLTPQNGEASILVLGIVDHRRVLPLAWRVLPQQEAWPQPQIAYLRAMVADVVATLPSGCTVTLLADRGITGPAIIDLRAAVGWHGVLRVSVGPAVRLPEDTEGDGGTLSPVPTNAGPGPPVQGGRLAGGQGDHLLGSAGDGTVGARLRPAGGDGASANTGVAPTRQRPTRTVSAEAGTSSAAT